METRPAARGWTVGLAAFAVGTAVVFTGGGWVWPVAGLVVAIFSRDRFLIAACGLFTAAVTWAWLHAQLAPPPAVEGPDYDLIYVGPLLLVATGVAVWIGGRLVPPGNRPRSTRRRGVRLVSASVALGLAAVTAASVTLALEVRVPSCRSFDLPLPDGWAEVPRRGCAGYQDPTYGAHYTAVLGAVSDFRNGSTPPTVPTLGVTVIRSAYDSRECIRSVHGWSPSNVPIYEWPVVAEGDAVLPVGPVYRVIREPEEGMSRLYGWGITRSRTVGVLREELCYMLVLATPPDSGIGGADAERIAAGFAFR